MAQMQELIALLEKSGDAKTKIIDKQSEMITFLKSHIQTLGILLDEYDEIVQKYINQKQKNYIKNSMFYFFKIFFNNTISLRKKHAFFKLKQNI